LRLDHAADVGGVAFPQVGYDAFLERVELCAERLGLLFSQGDVLFGHGRFLS
jgi:hypothetical protein